MTNNLRKNYETLFKPSKIGALTLKNRIVLPPATTGFYDNNGNLTDQYVRYMAERAKGGVGLIVTEACLPEAPRPGSTLRFNLDSPVSTQKLHELADIVHGYGAKLGLQVSAGPGRVDLEAAGRPLSASETPSFANPSVLSQAMTTDEIHDMVRKIGVTAMKGVFSGADLINIHAHNGYLIDQFMSPQWNKRTDEYGGSLEIRMRFPKEIIQEIRNNVGPHVPIVFRISIDQTYEGGRKVEDSIDILRYLVDECSVDALDVDDGVYESLDMMFPPYYHGDTPYSNNLKKLASYDFGVPILASGSHTPETMVDYIDNNLADFVQIARPLIADPYLPKKLQEGKPEDVKPCILCNEFCIIGVLNGWGLGCSVNGQVGKEINSPLESATVPKKIVVVGGGPAGLEAAITAKKLGHEVEIYEASDAVGGLIKAAATPPFKSRLRELIVWYERQIENLQIPVKFNNPINADSKELESADYIFVANGSTEIVPPMDGIDGDNIVKVVEAHHHQEQIKGENILIAGGGLSGCDFGLELAMKGKKVTIVEMRDQIAAEEREIEYENLAISSITLALSNKLLTEKII